MLHNLSSSTNLVKVNKPREMRWMGHVAHMGLEMHQKTEREETTCMT